MKFIKLTRGFYAMVDDEDHEFLSQFKWSVKMAPRTWYARTNVGGLHTKRTSMCMHQLLALGAPNVDHEDRNGLNNVKSNLRFATLSQNHGNQAKTSSPTSSRYKGVCRRSDNGRWIALIGGGNRETKIRLGTFDNEIEVAKAYDCAAKTRFGIFARVNFPDAVYTACALS